MKRTVTAAFSVILLIVLVLSGCAGQEERAVFCLNAGTHEQAYAAALAALLPDYEIKETVDGVFSELQHGNAVCAFDAQAVPMLENGVAEYWYPQYLATAVIAVDRDKTAAEISGWRDLARISDTVCFADDGETARLLFAAVAYGLEGEGYTADSAVNLLRAIAGGGRLKRGDSQAPVLICMDYRAAALKRAGANIEIVVPSEGTLCFKAGVVSSFPVEFTGSVEQAVLSAGLRTLDGGSADEIYPPTKDYERAARVSDFSRLAERTERANRDFRHKILHTRMYSSADQIQHQLVVAVFVAIVTLWAGFALNRILDEKTRRLVIAAALLIVGWVLLRYIKYQLVTEGLAARMCWYGYYIFQLSLPLVMLWLAWSLDCVGPDGAAKSFFKKSVAAAQAVLLALVLTNDLHMLIFKMDLSRPGWSANYSYEPLYYAVLAASVVPVLLSVVIMLKKAWGSPRRSALVFPVAFSLLFAAYGAGYVLGIPLARDSDFAMTIGIFTILFFEAALQSGLIPVNTNYRRLFEVSPLKMQIVDESGVTALASSESEPLDEALWNKVSASFGSPLSKDDDTVIFADPITGGAVVWFEDISEINAIHREILENIEKLKAANALLSKEKDAKAKTASARQKLFLTSELKKEIRGCTDKLSRMISGLEACEDKRTETARITLLMCYIKRRCNLFFRELEAQAMPADELAVYLDELAEFSKYAGVRIITACDVTGSLPVRHATLIYDVFYALVELCAYRNSAHVLAQLVPGEGGAVLKLLPSFAPRGEYPDAALKRSVEAAGGSISVKEMDETAGISIFFPKGGAADA